MLVQKYITGTTAVNIASSIEAALSSGRASARDQLPPVRALAAHLRVSPATVAAAYRLLRDRGVAAADGRRGTRLRAAAPLAVPAVRKLPPGVRDLAAGNPDPTLLPDLAAAMRKTAIEQHLYRDELDDPHLIDLAREQFRTDGVPAESVGIVSGALDGVERVLRERLRPGDRVAVEDPCFTGILDLLAALSLAPVPVAVDDEGLRPGALRDALTTAQALVLTPRAQNPTGAALTAGRARELRRTLAAHPDLLVIEDDHAGPVAGAPYVTLVAGRMRWAVVRSVSKPLGPDLRLATLAADPQTLARVQGRQALGIRWVSHVLQRLVVTLWSDRSVRRLLAKAERTYAARRQAFVAALESCEIEAHGVSGLNVWIPVREESATVQALMQRGWAVQAGERYRIETPPAIRVTIASLEPADAIRLAADIAQVVLPRRVRSQA